MTDTALWRFLRLDRIGGQIAALVICSLLAFHVFITIAFLYGRPDPREPATAGPQELATAFRLYSSAPDSERAIVLKSIQRTFPSLDLKLAEPAEVLEAEDGPGAWRGPRGLGPGYRVMGTKASASARMILVMPDGHAVSSNVPEFRSTPLLGGPWMTALFFGVISISLLCIWAARAVTAPLSAAANAADDFSVDRTPSMLPESGPREVRSVARALNTMRQRVIELINGQTKMLAAVSHDLRTPITRMRLRAEFIEDPQQRVHMLQDLDQLRSMIDSVLSYLRDSREAEAFTFVDVAATVQLVGNEFADMGHSVTIDADGHVMITARPNDMRRAITNLVENAVKFGGTVTLRVAGSDPVLIEVEDDGPGIADELKHAVLEPFVRGDDARNLDKGTGFGLGMTISRAIVQAHGGSLSLHDRKPHGLIVRIELAKQHCR